MFCTQCYCMVCALGIKQCQSIPSSMKRCLPQLEISWGYRIVSIDLPIWLIVGVVTQHWRRKRLLGKLLERRVRGWEGNSGN
jgi:hypothetical protein